MPIYEYRCEECAQVFEEWQKDYEEKALPCPMCGGRSKRLISNSAFVLKGSGWYTTDYCNRSSSPKSETPSSSGDSGKSESTSAAKPDAKAANA